MKPLQLFLLCLPLTLAADLAVQEFTSGNNLFTTSVYKELTKVEPGNFLVSPFSAESILSLVYVGAKDETSEELRRNLYLPSQQKTQIAIKALQPSLRRNDLYTLLSANRMYVRDDFPIKDNFRLVAENVFGADLAKIDFNQTKQAARSINRWVEERTQHKIRDLIAPDQLDNRTRSVLINALYFKGNWTAPFAKYDTRKEVFFQNGVNPVRVDTMHDVDSKKYFESRELGAKFLEMNFEGDALTLTVVLPNEPNGLRSLERQMERVLQRPEYSLERVRVSLPKFRIETQTDFKSVLENLGVRRIFRGDQADLSRISGEKGQLVVDKVAQKAYLDLNEEGVEAAAASFASVGVPLSGYFPVSPPKEFKADHPFIFYIKKEDLVLFAGRVVDPSDN